jgi:hypothetical protein
MTPITEELLKENGWKLRERGQGIAFYLKAWTQFQEIKLSYDERRKQYRLHWAYNDTNVAFMEDIDTMTELWQHASVNGGNLQKL